MKQLFLVLLVALSVAAQAQIKRFSMIPDEYMTQLTEFFGTSGSKQEELETTFKQFIETFNVSPLSTPEMRESIINTSNTLLEKRAKPDPHFLHYLQALNGFAANPDAFASYEAWNEALDFAIRKKNIRVADDYLQTSSLILQKNIMYESPSATWAFRGGSYQFKFDKEPSVEFENITLTCRSKGDSSQVFSTSGVLLPFENHWTGKGGEVYWVRAGFTKETVNAKLRNYAVDVTKANYTADSVTFINSVYYDEPMLGSFEEKIIANTSAEDASYPRFDSYEKLFKIEDIYPGVDYQGGFSMRGSKFVGSGSNEQQAMLFFKRYDTVRMVCRSKFFVIRKDQLTGQNTSVTYYLDKDSIYHPGLKLKYVVKNREVSLIRDGDPQSMARAPYYNSYHKIDMDFELLTWQVERPEILMGAMKGSIVNKSYFESENYFRESRYLELEMLDKINPLVALKRFSKERGNTEFWADDLAGYMRLPLTEVRHLCLMLSYKGIITYDINNDKIILRQRLFDYLDARVGKKDYDVIKFDSEHDMVGLESANLRLTDNFLKIYGVPRIAVSDSQNVIIYPRGRQLIVKKNRDFEFDGVIEAGLFTFFGQGFEFSYQDFKIGLENIDSLKIKVTSFEEDAYGTKGLVDIQNVVENITGELRIDDPNNKSSVKNFPQYPIFTSKQDSYVYYDYPITQDGVYDREKFYFAIDPYEVDSLNSFSTSGLTFEGNFTSADIFQPMRDRLTVQPDYSLGFRRYTGTEGYPVYGGKGMFYDTIMLSNRGLMGNGKITYLNSTAESKEFVFLIDSMNAVCDKYEIKKQTAEQGAEFPAVEGEGVKVHWEPYKDLWDTEQGDSLIQMYGGMATLAGGTSFSPKGLTGRGKFKFGNAQLTSGSYSFEEHEMMADTASFDLVKTGGDNKELAFKTQNIKAYVDFNQKKGMFTSNDELTVVQFPQNKYICYLDRFSWDMVTEEMQLGTTLASAPDAVKKPGAEAKPESEDLGGAHFISVHPKQDTLNFTAPYSTYDLKKYIIHAEEVDHINVADSRVFPGEKGKVTVLPDAKMETLKEAKILTPLKKEYHNIYDATLDVTGRLSYSGSGKLNYEDRNGKIDTLRLDLIKVDSAGSTMANGNIAEADTFFLSPEYRYQGKFRLNAEQKYLNFEGTTRIIHKCDSMPSYWFKFKESINPNNIMIPIDEELNDIDNKRLYTGMFMKTDSVHIYSAFLGKRKKFNDIQVISAFGYINYDEATKRFTITNKEKLKDPDAPGNLFSLNSDYCYTYGEGDLNLGLDIGQVKMKTLGTITHNIASNVVNMETFMSLKFFFPEELLKIMADTISRNPNLPGVDMTRKVVTKNINQLVGSSKARELINDINLYGNMKRLPEEMVSTITFSQLDMYWDPQTTAYRSTGKIGVNNILDKPVNKLMKGYVELQKRKTGDQIDIYLEVSERDWYYFSYTREVMQVVSTNDDFNLFIETLKDDKRKLKASKKEAQYSFYLSSVTRKDIFVKRFKRREDERAGLIAPEEDTEDGSGYDMEQPEQPERPKTGRDAGGDEEQQAKPAPVPAPAPQPVPDAGAVEPPAEPAPAPAIVPEEPGNAPAEDTGN